MRIRCLPKNTTQCPQSAELGPLIPESSALALRLSRLEQATDYMDYEAVLTLHVADVLIQFTSQPRNVQNYLALINRAGGLYGRILTEVVSTDRTQ